MNEFTTDPDFADEDVTGLNPDAMGAYEVFYTPEDALPELMKDEVIGWDLETTGFSPISDKIALIQMYGQQTGTVYLQRVVNGIVPEKVLKFFQESKAIFVGHNIANFDIPFMISAGLEGHKNIKWFDTLIAETLVVGINRQSVKKSLQASVRRRLGMTINKDIAHSNWGAETLSEDQVTYAVSDVIHLPALMEVQMAKAFESEQHEALELENQLIPIVASMRLNGLPIDLVALEDFLQKQEIARDRALKDFLKEFPGVNPRSPVKLKQAIISKGVMVKDTRKETLLKYAHFGDPHQVHIAKTVLNYREPDQLMKMYGGDFVEKYVDVDGRIHPNIWTCSTDTTRFSSSGPNGQQIPGSMRYVFAAPGGYKYVAPDYSQLEVRIEADVAEDYVLIDALKHEDTHTAIAAMVFGVPVSRVTKTQRKKSKAMVFTLLFGGSAKALYEYSRAQGSDITMADAQDMYNKFFGRFVGLRELISSAVQLSRRNFVTLRLPYGYRRILDRDKKKSTVIVNTLVQGTAAVGTKLALIEAGKRGLDKYLGMQLHDEFIAGAVPANEAEEYNAELCDAMKTQMETLVTTGVPIKVEGQIGDTWAG